MRQYFERLDRIADIREMTENIDKRAPGYTRRKLERMSDREKRY